MPGPASADFVEATETLDRRLFSLALVAPAALALWGVSHETFNGSSSTDAVRSVSLGLAIVVAVALSWAMRDRLYRVLRREPRWLLVPVVAGAVVLWIDGVVHSELHLASCGAILLAAVVAGARWALVCAVLLAGAYAVGALVVHDHSVDGLDAASRLDDEVTRAGGYLVLAALVAPPVRWVQSTSARLHQIVTDHSQGVRAPGPRRTDPLSAREIEVCQLVAAGMSNDQIAERLYVSPRTVQTHLTRSMRKTETTSRTELAVLLVREGLCPAEPPEE